MDTTASLIILALVSLLFLPQLIAQLRARALQGRPAPDISHLIDQRQREYGNIMLYFFSPACGPCRAMTPVIDELAQRHGNVIAVDVMQSSELAGRFGVMGTPTTVLVRDGKIQKMLMGKQSAGRLEALLG